MSDKTIRKPEKLASAMYLLTSFFPDQEPLKWRLRTLVSDVVSGATTLRDNFSGDQASASLKIRKTVLEISSLLAVARDSGLVSNANYEIVAKEFESYLGKLSLPEGMSGEGENVLLSIGTSQDEPARREETKPAELPEQKDISVKDTSETQEIGERRELLDTNELEEVASRPKTPKLKEFGAVSVKKNNRKSIIVGLLKRKKEITIKDVSPLISGCSDKTIQRELAAMVDEGILKKEGEKRWSRYSLA